MGPEGAYAFAAPPEEQAPDSIEDFGLKATVVLREGPPHAELPRGVEGETRPGYAFFEQRMDGTLAEDPITLDMTDKPELVVADEEEYRALQAVTIIAKPVNFIWSAERNSWMVEPE